MLLPCEARIISAVPVRLAILATFPRTRACPLANAWARAPPLHTNSSWHVAAFLTKTMPGPSVPLPTARDKPHGWQRRIRSVSSLSLADCLVFFPPLPSTR